MCERNCLDRNAAGDDEEVEKEWREKEDKEETMLNLFCERFSNVW